MLEVSITKSTGDFSLASCFTAEKEILGILGPSGCGKSMTLQCIAGLQQPDEGRIVLNGKILYDSQRGIHVSPRFRKIGYMFQNYALFPHLTVAQNIAFGIQHVEKITRRKLVSEMIEKMHLAGLADSYSNQLSGGQQQRVALARTLITQPELLLLDEPFSALDNHVKSHLELELQQTIQNSYAGTVLLVTHNLDEAYRLCDRIIMYSKGQIVQIGKKEEIIHQPANLTVARITGCKNLFPVEIAGEEGNALILRAKGLLLKARKYRANDSKKMIAGIRAHHLQIRSDFSDTINSFTCEIMNTIEGVFSTTIMAKCFDHIFQVEVSKEKWSQLIDSKNRDFYLHFPFEHIFLVDREEEENAIH